MTLMIIAKVILIAIPTSHTIVELIDLWFALCEGGRLERARKIIKRLLLYSLFWWPVLYFAGILTF